MKLFLVGLLGSGKSFLGKELSKIMNLPFIDLDEAIEAQEGAKVSEVFSTKGEAHFRMIEAAVLRQQSRQENFVMATGGGTPCFHDNMEYINQTGTSVFLDTSIPEIAMRLKQGQLQSRPLLANVPEDQLPVKLKSMLDSRIEFYKKAHVHAQGAMISAEGILELLSKR